MTYPTPEEVQKIKYETCKKIFDSGVIKTREYIQKNLMDGSTKFTAGYDLRPDWVDHLKPELASAGWNISTREHIPDIPMVNFIIYLTAIKDDE